MDLLLDNVPLIGKYKAYFAGFSLMLAGLAGLFTASADVAHATSLLLSMQIGIFQWSSDVQVAVAQALPFFAGFGIVGLRHGQKKEALTAAAAMVDAMNTPQIVGITDASIK